MLGRVIRRNICIRERALASLCSTPFQKKSIQKREDRTFARHLVGVRGYAEDNIDWFAHDEFAKQENDNNMSPEDLRNEAAKIQQDMNAAATDPQDFYHLQQKSKTGDPIALLRLGSTYLYGVDGITAPDQEKGLELLYQSGMKGCAQGFFAIGTHWEEHNTPRNAFPWYFKAAEMGLAAAMLEVALRYEHGDGVHQDTDESLYWYKQAAENGDPRAMHNLALRYLSGRGVPMDKKKAKELFEAASNEGMGDSHHQLSILYEEEGDEEKALNNLLFAARADNEISQYNLAMLYYTGQIEPPNRKVTREQETIKWFRKSAKFKLKEAQVVCGYLYNKGDCVEQDLKESKKYFLDAAKNGSDFAKYMLAYYYAAGIGEDANVTEARKIVDDLAKNSSHLATTIKTYDDTKLATALTSIGTRSLEKFKIKEAANARVYEPARSTKPPPAQTNPNIPRYSFL